MLEGGKVGQECHPFMADGVAKECGGYEADLWR